MSDVTAKLADLGLELPKPAAPVAAPLRKSLLDNPLLLAFIVPSILN